MTTGTAQQLRAKADAAWANLTGQLRGMEPHLERSDAPGEWTTRQVLAHLLFQPGWDARTVLGMFATRDYPVFDVKIGQVQLDDARRAMSLKQFIDALDAQRQAILGYLESQPEADLHARKARIPALAPFVKTEEFSLAMFAGTLLDGHWRDHAGQLAKIRKAAGLPDA